MRESHCCQIPPGLLGQFSQKNLAAGEKIKKIRPLEKKLGRKPATPQIIRKSAEKNFCYKFLGHFLPIIVKIRPQLGNLVLGRFLGRKKFYWAIFGSSGPEFGHLAPVASLPPCLRLLPFSPRFHPLRDQPRQDRPRGHHRAPSTIPPHSTRPTHC
jgi:hypothetical protein